MKRVVVIASGETERRSLPHLLGHLRAEGISIVEVRRPDGHKALNVEMADRLAKASWYSAPVDQKPDKFVVLVDADGNDPEQVLSPFRNQLPTRLALGIVAALQFACAQWHLEAWYFADHTGLKGYLRRALGNVGIAPDEIQNPKLHLRNLLGDRVYTAVISAEIASKLDAKTIAQRSPSFRGLLDAVRNGNSAQV